ncbi:flagellar hook-length control protein FliK [Marinobacter apostichopi]|uniref:flagellar hook-length control protein FliK n=1 Tax=Marinobacter apostichopi TaxID=3035454 RepID=UPI0025724216|nr:flagellar hook-length control protein FliK [Marinobacter sp. LA51]
MAQMVLPQTPAPGMKTDVNPAKSGSAREPDGESRYESVSRAEQKRLDRQESDRRSEQATNDARKADNDRSSEPAGQQAAGDSKTADNADKASADNSAPDESAAGSTGKVEVSEGSGNAAGEALEGLEETVVPPTFAELQALLTPASGMAGMAVSGKAAEVSGTTGPLPTLMPVAGALNAGSGVKPGQIGQVGQSSPGLTAGLQLTEALAATVGSETSRPADPASLIASGRFQSSLEVAGQQVANAAAVKVPAEAAVPLKSYATSIDTPVGQADWGDKLVGKLSWLTARNMSVAEIHLTPADLGPMEVKVRVQNEQANITVHSANPIVREQLEQQSHRLRDMLGEQGLNLARFDVSDSPQQRSGEQSSGEEQGSGKGGHSGDSLLSDADEADIQAGSLDLSWKGEVDVFA